MIDSPNKFAALLWVVLPLLGGLCSTAVGAESTAPAELNSLSDRQLTNLAADWDALDETQRAELIQETRERMRPGNKSSTQSRRQAQHADSQRLSEGHKTLKPNATTAQSAQQQRAVQQQRGVQQRLPQQGVQQQRVQQQIERRRYGRLVRQPDGSVVRIQTEVVRISRRDPKRAYGVGFEQRHQRHQRQGSQGSQGSQRGQSTLDANSPGNPAAKSPHISQPAATQPAGRPNVISVQDPVN